MIYKPKRRRYYMVKFMWRGRLIHKATRATDAKTARAIEGKIRADLARGEWDILERKPLPTLSEFLNREFLPFVETTFKTKPNTLEYYSHGVKRLLDAELASLRLDEITNQHAAAFAARAVRQNRAGKRQRPASRPLSPSTINCGLRTLRRALNLAFQWGKLERPIKISLAKGERQRERVLTDGEAVFYLDVCPQPWRDVATLILGTGMRPGEAYALRWERVLLNGSGGFIQIAAGKSRAARRLLPMVPEVYAALHARWEAQGQPAEGWVFPAASASGHLEQGTAKSQHDRALRKLRAAHEAYRKWQKGDQLRDWTECIREQTGLALAAVARHSDVIMAGVKPFEPYCLRHTALTRLAEAGCDAFTLARIAGHSSITVTQRYCHPQADAIARAFDRLARTAPTPPRAGSPTVRALGPASDSDTPPQEVVNDGGQHEIPLLPSRTTEQVASGA